MTMPGRNYNAGTGYRYGLNGKENDNSTGEGNLDFGARIMDVRLGKWLSVDPIFHAWMSTYCAIDNNPILKIDPDGQSTHTDKDGNVILVTNDKNNGVYWHKNLDNKDKIDNFRNEYNKTKKYVDKGIVMGRTMIWNSFRDDNDKDVGKIDFTSKAGMIEVIKKSTILMNMKLKFIKDGSSEEDADLKVRAYYGVNAGGFNFFDIKRGGYSEEEFNKLSVEQQNNITFAGSKLSNNTYASMRDFGNFLAGRVAKITNQDYKAFLQIAGLFNKNNNNKTKFAIELMLGVHKVARSASYGEKDRSNFFQRFGYHLITNQEQLNKKIKNFLSDYK